MTVAVQSSESIFLGNGVSTTFTFPWQWYSADTIEVSFTDTSGTQTILTPTQYTLVLNPAGVGQLWGTGGTVTYPTMGAPMTTGTSLTVRRTVPFSQETDVTNQTSYPVAVETALDTLAFEIQQIATRAGQFRGTWATGISYNFGDIAIDGANGTNTLNYYVCVINNTSGVWATDLANGDWTLFINIQQINADVVAAAASATAAANSAAAAATSATNSANSAATATTEAGIATTQAGVATTEAGIATTQASNAAASASAAATSAASVIGLTSTSTTSQAITMGAVTFTTQANKGYFTGQQIIIASNAGATNYMHGTVTSYSGTTLVTNITDTGGTGTHADWNISVSGTQGPSGPSGSGAAPGGTNGQVQYNNSNVLGGFTVGGDGTLNTTTGAITITKTNGSAFVASATTDTTNATNISSGVLAAARGGAGAINGILKANGSGVVSLAAANTDYQAVITLTTTGSTGAATFNGTTLNIPDYASGAGTVTSVTFTGDGTVLSSTPSSAVTTTGTLTASLANATAKSLLGNATSSGAAPSYETSPVVSGSMTAASLIPTGSSIPANGLYLPSANTPGIASNSRLVATFIGGGSAADYVTFTSQSVGTGPLIGVGSSGSNSPLLLTSLGTGSILLYSNTTGTLLATFANSGAATLNVAGATMTAGSFTANSATVPVNGVYLPSANTVGVASNSKLVATFNSPGAGGNSWAFQNVATSGQSAVTSPSACTIALAGGGAGNLGAGNYSYKMTFVGTLGETALGTSSNIVNVTSPGTNGKMSLTAIPVSGSGTVTARNIYRTMVGGSNYFFLHQIADNTTTTFTDNIADTSLTFGGPASQQQIPVYVVLSPLASGGDTAVGYQIKTLGTTVTGEQFNGNTGQGDAILATGTIDFMPGGVLACRITDTYWNPNAVYAGAPDGGIVISSGSSSGGAETSAVVSAEIFNSATATSATLRLNAKGPSGEIHLVTNGYVCATAEAGVNPNGNNSYADSYWFGFGGVAQTVGATPAISLQSSNGLWPDNPNYAFYHGNTGDMLWASDNAQSALFRMFRVANAVNQLYAKPSATGGTSFLGVGGSNLFQVSDTNAPLGLTSNGTGTVGVYSQSGANLITAFTNTKDTVPLGVSAAAVATSATGGFLYLTACAGTPSGTPTNASAGNVPHVWDSTHKMLWLYDNASTSWIGNVSAVVKTGSGSVGTIALTAQLTTYFITTGGGTGTVTIPASANLGRRIVFKDVDGNAGTNNFTISVASAGTIDGGANAALFTNYQSLTLQENATEWSLIQ